MNLSKFSLFSGLSEAECAVVHNVIKWIDVKKGTVLFSNGEQSTDFYLVCEGKMRSTTYSFAGKEVSYQDLQEGAVFGELSAIDCRSRTTGMIAISDCVIGKIKSDDFWTLMEAYPQFMRKIVVRITELVRFLVSRVYEYSAMNVTDRIRAEIIRYARENMTGSNSARIENMPTHEEIANRVTTHREAVTKEISSLVKSGVIEKEGKIIIVPDMSALEALIMDSL